MLPCVVSKQGLISSTILRNERAGYWLGLELSIQSDKGIQGYDDMWGTIWVRIIQIFTLHLRLISYYIEDYNVRDHN